jgi:hypothetical protein
MDVQHFRRHEARRDYAALALGLLTFAPRYTPSTKATPARTSGRRRGPMSRREVGLAGADRAPC